MMTAQGMQWMGLISGAEEGGEERRGSGVCVVWTMPSSCLSACLHLALALLLCLLSACQPLCLSYLSASRASLVSLSLCDHAGGVVPCPPVGTYRGRVLWLARSVLIDPSASLLSARRPLRYAPVQHSRRVLV
eukprot:COSAG06_NODE_8523_length_2140_cov_12.719745_2_plen_133_part_00